MSEIPAAKYKKIEAIIETRRSPIVTLTHANSEAILGRGMGFIVDPISQKTGRIVTARHVADSRFLAHDNDSELHVRMTDAERTRLEVTDIRYPEENYDLGIIEYRSPVKLQKLQRFDLSGAKDTFDPKDLVWTVSSLIGKSLSRNGDYCRHIEGADDPDRALYFTLRDEMAEFWPKNEESKRADLLGKGMKEYGVARLQSAPGFSGSPIWSPEFRWKLHGMIVRGRNSFNVAEAGYVTRAKILELLERDSAR